MRKIIGLLTAVIIVLAAFTGCASETPSAPAERVKVRVAALKGPTAMGMVKLMDDSESADLGNDYSFTIAPSVDEITPALVKGELDISAVQANLASVLYNNTDGKVRALAVNTLGVLYIVERGDTVKSAADLRGKTIYTAGKGAVPEYVLNYVLRGSGLDPEKDVTIEFKSEHAECVAALTQDKTAIAMLPQPFVTTAMQKDDSIRVALDLNAEWEALQTGEDKSALITGVVVARTEFIEQHPEAVDEFLEGLESSVGWVNANTAEAAKLIEKYDIVPEAVAVKALPKCNIVYMGGDDMADKLGGYLKALYGQNPQSIGGALPDEAFYYRGK